MSLKILEVKPNTWSGDEFVKIQVLEDCNLGEFAVTDETFDKEGRETDIFRHVYFFPQKAVKQDEIIFLYTSPGNYKSSWEGVIRKHTFHWGSEESIWNKERDTATIIKYKVVDTHNYNTSKYEKLNKIVDGLLNDEK